MPRHEDTTSPPPLTDDELTQEQIEELAEHERQYQDYLALQHHFQAPLVEPESAAQRADRIARDVAATTVGVARAQAAALALFPTAQTLRATLRRAHA